MNIITDYLPYDSELLKELNDPKLWEELSSFDEDIDTNNSEGYKWWDGVTEPSNIWEKLIKHIWSQIPPGSIAGYEYWANICFPNNELDWHQDKDEKLFDEKDQTVCPTISTVFYGFPHTVKGGYLEIHTNNPKDTSLTERIKPIFNRLVIFNPSNYHRVMPIEEGVRFAFQVNVWEEAPSFVSQDTLEP